MPNFIQHDSNDQLIEFTVVGDTIDAYRITMESPLPRHEVKIGEAVFGELVLAHSPELEFGNGLVEAKFRCHLHITMPLDDIVSHLLGDAARKLG